VLVQAVGAYGYDNRYVVDAARAHPGRLASVVAVGPQHARLPMDGNGVRLFAIPDASWLDDVSCVDIGVPVVMTMLSSEVPRLARFLERFPRVVVALDHCGFADLRDEAAPLFDLARHRSLHLKVSSIVLEGVTDPRDAVDRLAAAFGPDRLLWGSDFPQTHDRPYAALVGLARHACSRLSRDEQAAFLGGNALRLWPSLA